MLLTWDIENGIDGKEEGNKNMMCYFKVLYQQVIIGSCERRYGCLKRDIFVLLTGTRLKVGMG